jgi:hypothetical protein
LTLLFLIFSVYMMQHAIQIVAIVAMGARLSRLATHGAVPPAHDARTVHELKTRAHAVTACAPCDMPG